MSVTGDSGTSTSAVAVDRRNRFIGISCGVAVVLLFSAFTLVSRLGFASSLTLADIAALRFIIAGVLMLPVLFQYGLSGVRWRDAAALAFTGGLGFALLAYAGLYLAPAVHGAVLLHGTIPLFTFVLVWVATSPTVETRRGLGLSAIALGILAMVVESIASSTPRQLLGDVALLLASVSWSAYGLLARRIGLAPAHSASIVAVLSMCCFLPLYLVLPGKAILFAPWRELVLQGVFQGVLIGAIGIFIYSRAVATLGAVETALFTAAIPCVTTLAAVLLLGEVPSAMAVVGVVIVTVGMALSMTGQNPPTRVDVAERKPKKLDSQTSSHTNEAFNTMDFRTVRRFFGDNGYEHRPFVLSQEERSWWRRS